MSRWQEFRRGLTDSSADKEIYYEFGWFFGRVVIPCVAGVITGVALIAFAALVAN